MKILMLMRHAKSSWSDDYPDDFDRPLNKRGLRDAPRMGAMLAQQVLTPDRIVSSSARRAADTAAAVAAACGYEGELELTRDLYLAHAETYLELAAQQHDNVQRLLLIGHNPGIGILAQELSEQPLEMPTAALAQYEVDVTSWSELRRSTNTELRAYWRPADLDDTV